MNRSELVKTLELVKPALASTNVVPIFQCFNFTEGTVSASNDDIAIVGPAETDETFGVHGATLLGLLSNSKVEDVEIELKQDTAVLVQGKSVSKLPFQPEENFIFSPPDGKWDFKVPFTTSLFDGIKLCLETVSTDTTQLALLGVTIQGDKLYSCNGDALTRIKLKTGVGRNRVLMSTPFCNAVAKLWSSLEMTKGMLYFNNDWVFADFDDWSVYGRILEIQAPIDFEDLIKRNLKTQTPTQELPAGFSDALSRARVLADPETQKTVITVSKGKLQLLTQTPMGEVRDDLGMKGHPDVVANVNASHLQRAISSCDQIAFLENCTLLEKVPDVLQLVSNMS